MQRRHPVTSYLSPFKIRLVSLFKNILLCLKLIKNDFFISFFQKVSRLILLAGANPNVRTEFLHNAPLLCVAAREGFSDMVALLLEFGADINASSDTGMTALCFAAAAGHREVLHMLCVRKNARVRKLFAL